MNTAPGRSVGQAGSVLNRASELTTRRIDIVPSGSSNCRDFTAIRQIAGKRPNTFGRRSPQTGCRERIERNQIELTGQRTRQREQLLGVLRLIIDPIQHHVLGERSR